MMAPIYIADAAVYLMKKKPELGIKNPYELTPDQYAAAVARCFRRSQGKLVGRYWHDAMVQVDDFKNEGVVASSSWPFQVNLAGDATRRSRRSPRRFRKKGRQDGPTRP